MRTMADVKGPSVDSGTLMDAHCILTKLHSRCTGLLSCKSGRSFEGLGAAARHCRKMGLISPNTSRKIQQLDVCCAWMRHASVAKADELSAALAVELGSATCSSDENAGREPMLPAETRTSRAVAVVSNAAAGSTDCFIGEREMGSAACTDGTIQDNILPYDVAVADAREHLLRPTQSIPPATREIW